MQQVEAVLLLPIFVIQSEHIELPRSVHFDLTRLQALTSHHLSSPSPSTAQPSVHVHCLSLE